MFGINSNTLLFWGGVAYTLGYVTKSKQVQEIGGYGVIAGVAWYFVSDVLGLF